MGIFKFDFKSQDDEIANSSLLLQLNLRAKNVKGKKNGDAVGAILREF